MSTERQTKMETFKRLSDIASKSSYTMLCYTEHTMKSEIHIENSNKKSTSV